MKNLVLIAISVLTFGLCHAQEANIDSQTVVHRDRVARHLQVPKPTSSNVTVTSTSISVLWLRDGFDNYTAVSLPVYHLPNAGPIGISLNAIGAFDPNNTSNGGQRAQLYAGTGLNLHYNVGTSGWAVDALFGFKGVDVLNGFKADQGKKDFVFGLGVTIPLGH